VARGFWLWAREDRKVFASVRTLDPSSGAPPRPIHARWRMKRLPDERRRAARDSTLLRENRPWGARSMGMPARSLAISPRSSPCGDALARWRPANRPSPRLPATLVSSRRPERARSLASTSANDGCLVHPVSHFESRASVAFLAVGSSPPGGGEAPLEGWDDSCPPAPRDRRRSRERSRSMGDGPRHIELSLRRDSGSWLDGQ
jgi:hypothetical protein